MRIEHESFVSFWGVFQYQVQRTDFSKTIFETIRYRIPSLSMNNRKLKLGFDQIARGRVTLGSQRADT